jgi:enoyl-CoA hydratase/carnithine racemase
VTIAAVDGVAVGLGAELAIACDVRFAGDDARFCFPELSRGLFPTNGVTARVPALVGSGRAHELLLGGAWIDADAADAIGLARRAAGSAADAADAFADRALQTGNGERGRADRDEGVNVAAPARRTGRIGRVSTRRPTRAGATQEHAKPPSCAGWRRW